MSESIATTVRNLRDEWIEEYGYTPRGINEGDCLTFANEVIAKCPAARMKRTGDDDVLGRPETPQYDVEPFHVWLTDGQRHYDAECPDGVDDWRDLPFFKRAGFGE